MKRVKFGTYSHTEIRLLKNEDELMLRHLFNSLDEKTDDNYGRFNQLRYRGETIARDIIEDKEEIGIIAYSTEHYYDGPAVGYAHLHLSILPSRRHSASFGIVVHQDYQGQGIGEALLKEAIKIAKK